MGRELNPRIGDFDIKFFTELRPGLLGWIWINFCFAYKQYHDLNRVTNSMILVLAFHTFYVADALWNEEKVLTTIDITSGKNQVDQLILTIHFNIGDNRGRWIYAYVWVVLLAAHDIYYPSSLLGRLPSGSQQPRIQSYLRSLRIGLLYLPKRKLPKEWVPYKPRKWQSEA